MPRTGFGGGGNYDGLFADLYFRDEAHVNEMAQAHANRVKEEQAAKDSEMFSKYEHGDISDSEILAYAKQRAADTHDPSDKAKWDGTVRDLEKQILDGQAEEAYAQGGDINDLIRYYRSRQASVEKNSPEYRSYQDRLNQLIDQRADEDISMGAMKIQDQIDRGKATIADLVAFYQRNLKGLRPNSPLHDQVVQLLDQARDQKLQSDQQGQLAQIEYKVNAGTMSAAQGAKQLRQIAATYKNSDPAKYYSMMNDALTLERQTTTADDGKYQMLQYELNTGQITPQQFLSQANSWADQFRNDPATYYSKLNTIYNQYQSAQAGLNSQNGGLIPNPGALGKYGGVPNGGYIPSGTYSPSKGNGSVDFITQLDGSKYSQLNCAFAAGAMLAEAMGVNDVSGGDLRWLSGDRQGGSNVAGIAQVLRGVGLDMDVGHGMGFQQVMQKLQAGQPAIIAGLNGAIPAQFRSSPQLVGAHMIYVDRYDPKKGFLVMNPAKRGANYQGEWWPPAVMKAFAWNGTLSGNVGFAPTKLLKLQSGSRVDLSRVKQISVWDAPKRSTTPKNYGVGNDPGIQGNRDRVVQNGGSGTTTSQTDKDGSQASTPPWGLHTPASLDELNAQLDIIQAHHTTATNILQAYSQGQTSYEDGYGNKIALTPNTVRQAEIEVNNSYDYGMALANAKNDQSYASTIAGWRGDTTAAIAQINNYVADTSLNKIISDWTKQVDMADRNEADPEKALQIAQSILPRLGFLVGYNVAGDKQYNADSGEIGKIAQLMQQIQVITNPDATDEQRQNALSNLPPDLAKDLIGSKESPGPAVGVAGMSSGVGKLRNGTGMMFLDPKAGWTIIDANTETRVDKNGNQIEVQVPNNGLTSYDMTYIIGQNNGKAVAIPTVPTQIDTSYTTFVDKNGRPVDISTMTKDQVATKMGTGEIQRIKATVPGVIVPQYTDSAGRVVPAATWVQDQGTGMWYNYDPSKRPGLPWLKAPDLDPLGFGTVKLGADGQIAGHYQMNADLGGVPMPTSVSDQRLAQDLWNSGQIDWLKPTTRIRDLNGNVTDGVHLPQGQEFTADLPENMLAQHRRIEQETYGDALVGRMNAANEAQRNQSTPPAQMARPTAPYGGFGNMGLLGPTDANGEPVIPQAGGGFDPVKAVMDLLMPKNANQMLAAGIGGGSAPTKAIGTLAPKIQPPAGPAVTTDPASLLKMLADHAAAEHKDYVPTYKPPVKAMAPAPVRRMAPAPPPPPVRRMAPAPSYVPPRTSSTAGNTGTSTSTSRYGSSRT